MTDTTDNHPYREPLIGDKEPLPTMREPTHILTFEVPLYIDKEGFYLNPVQDAIRICMGVSRIASLGLVCGEPIVTIAETE